MTPRRAYPLFLLDLSPIFDSQRTASSLFYAEIKKKQGEEGNAREFEPGERETRGVGGKENDTRQLPSEHSTRSHLNSGDL